MSVQRTRPFRTIIRRTSALAVGLVTTAALVLAAGPASATETRAAHSQSRPPSIELSSEDRTTAAFDVFRFFSHCLSLAAQPDGNQMYPSTPEDFENRVNACLGL